MLLAGPEGGAWCDAARAAGEALGVRIEPHRVGGDGGLDDPGGDFLEAYGLAPGGATLVRPDGYVGWRAPAGAETTRESVEDMLRSVLCLDAARA